MDRLIDQDGFVFGLVNIIDLLVLLLGMAVVVAGAALVSDSWLVAVAPVALGALAVGALARHDADRAVDEDAAEGSAIRLRVSEVEPYVADAITPGDTTTDDDLVVRDVHRRPALVVGDVDGSLVERDHPRLQTVEFTAEVDAEDGRPVRFRGDRLFVGRTLQLDLDRVRVDATVVALSETDTTGVEDNRGQEQHRLQRH